MKALSAKINTPCHEDWDKMKVGLHSRHCESCAKSVMDFTEMSREEIIEFLLTHRNDSVCGRMHKGQMDFYASDILVTIKALSKRKLSRNNSFFMLALSSWLLISCNDPASNSCALLTTEVDTTSTPTEEDLLALTSDSATVDSTTSSSCPTPHDTSSVPVPFPEELPMVGDVAILTGEVIIEEPVAPPPPDSLNPVFIETAQRDTIVQFPEQMAEYPGGTEKLLQDIRSKMEYPQYERDLNIQGTLYVRFIVSSSGVVSHPEVMRDVYDAPNFKKEAFRIISEMPNWTPAVHRGENVPSYMILPFKFRLQ